MTGDRVLCPSAHQNVAGGSWNNEWIYILYNFSRRKNIHSLLKAKGNVLCLKKMNIYKNLEKLKSLTSAVKKILHKCLKPKTNPTFTRSPQQARLICKGLFSAHPAIRFWGSQKVFYLRMKSLWVEHFNWS